MLRACKAALLGSLAVAAAHTAALADDYPTVNLKYGHLIAENYYQAAADKYFAAELAKRSDGKITTTFFWQESIGTIKELLGLTAAGAVDIGGVITGYFPSDLAFTSMTNALPMTFFDGRKVVEVTRELYKTNPSIVKELEAANLKPLIMRFLPNYRIICREPIRTLADLKGKKILSYGQFVPVVFDAVGALGVDAALSDTYEALQRGVIDCGYMHSAGIEFRKWHEVAPYLSDIDFGVINAYVVMMNLDRWKSFSPDVQAMIDEVALEASNIAIGDMQAEDERARQAMLDNGATLVVFEDKEAMAALVPDMIDRWVETMAKQGRGDEAKVLGDQARAALATSQ